MHLKRFNEFVRDLADDSSLKSSVHAIQVVRHFEGTWYREDGSEIQDQRLIKDLVSTLKLDRHWRRKNDTRAFFSVKPLDAVVVGIFQVKPAEGTRHKIHEQI